MNSIAGFLGLPINELLRRSSQGLSTLEWAIRTMSHQLATA